MNKVPRIANVVALAAAALLLSSTGLQAGDKSKPPVAKYKQLLSEYCWYIKKSGDPDHVCFEPDGRFSYNSLEADKGTWSLQGNKLSLAFADGRTKVWTIEFLTPVNVLQDGKVRWEAEMN